MAESKRFIVPNATRRKLANEPLSHENLEFKIAALTEDNWKDFKRKREPSSGDWLHSKKSDWPGQTYEEWAADILHKNYIPSLKRRRIYLRPIDDFGSFQDILPIIERYTSIFYTGCSIICEKTVSSKQITSRDVGHKQLLTTDILDRFAKRLPKKAFCVMGITMTDLYPRDDWNFVFGQASFQRRCGIFSFARLLPSFYENHESHVISNMSTREKKMFLRRCLGVITHEIGHLFGLSHCIWYECLMNGSNHLHEGDSVPLFLCPVCLHKLYEATTSKLGIERFSCQNRYRSMLEFFLELGLEKESTWLQKRMRIFTDLGTVFLDA